MKFLKPLLLFSAGIAFARLFPEQVDMIIEKIDMIDAEYVKSLISSVKDFVVSVYDIIVGNEDKAIEAAS